MNNKFFSLSIREGTKFVEFKYIYNTIVNLQFFHT